MARRRTVDRRLWSSLVWAMVLQFAAGGAVIPFVTLLLRERGLDLHQVSRIFAASSATMVVFPFLWGMLADRWMPLNRLFTLVNLLAGLSLALLVWQSTYVGMLVCFTLYYACYYPTLSLVTALSFHHLTNPREQFGRLRAWGSLGWIVPFLPISLWLTQRPKATFDFVLLLGIVACLGMAGVSLWLPHTPPGSRRSGSTEIGGALSYSAAVKKLLVDPDYLVLLVAMFLMAGSFSLMTFFSPALLQEVGITRPWIGPVQAIAVICEIFLFPWQARFIQRFDYAAVILAGCAALCARQLLFASAQSPWVLGGSYVLATAVIVFFNMGVSVLVNAMAVPQVRATAQTLLLLFGQGMGPLFANTVSVHITSAQGGNLRDVFLFAAVLAGLAVVVILTRGTHLNEAGKFKA